MQQLSAAKNGMTLSQTLGTIDSLKLDSQLGQAMGIDANYSQGVSYAQNSMYGEMSNQQSTKAKLDAQGGIDGAVGVDVTEAGQKAAQQKGAVEGLQQKADEIGNKIGESASKVLEKTANTLAQGKFGKDYNTIDSAGGASSFIQGQEQQGISAGSAMKKSMELASNQEAKQKIIDRELEAAAKLEKADPEHNKGLTEKVRKNMEELGLAHMENGKMVAARDANAWVRGRAGASANNATMEDAITLGGVTFDEKLNAHGDGSVVAKAGSSANSDNTVKASKGYDLDANRFNPETMEDQERLEYVQHALNPKKAAEKLFANAGDGAAKINKFLRENGIDTGYTDEEAREFGIKAADVAGIGLATVAVNQAPKAFGSNKTALEMWRGDKSATSNSDPVGKSENQPQNHDNQKSFNEPHSSTSSSNSKESITKITDSGKVVGLDRNGNLHEFNPNHGNSRGAYFRYNTGAASELKPSGTVLDNPGFWDKTGSFLGKALLLGGRVFAGGDTIMSGMEAKAQYDKGNTVAAVTNSLQSVTASAFMAKPGPFTGGAYAFATAINTTRAVADYFSTAEFSTQYKGNTPLMAGKDPYAANVPPHIRSAFRSNDGSNTLQAILKDSGGSGSVYNNAMDMRNQTPQGYKKDTSMDSFEATRDINRGLDSLYDNISELQESLAPKSDLDMDRIMKEQGY